MDKGMSLGGGYPLLIQEGWPPSACWLTAAGVVTHDEFLAFVTTPARYARHPSCIRRGW